MAKATIKCMCHFLTSVYACCYGDSNPGCHWYSYWTLANHYTTAIVVLILYIDMVMIKI